MDSKHMFGGWAAVAALALAANTALGAGAIAPLSGPVTLDLQYAKSVNGLRARHAVRACAGEATALRLMERQASTANDVLLRLLDGRGHEISRHSGFDAACAYVRYAQAYSNSNRMTVFSQADAPTDLWEVEVPRASGHN